MVDVLVDTNILIDMLRGYELSNTWKDSLGHQIIGISNVVYMEVVYGARNKQQLDIALKFLSQFEVILLTSDDQMWAMRQLTKYNLSHNVDLTDDLIAASAHRLNLKFYTRNTKHFLPIIPDLVTQPY